MRRYPLKRFPLLVIPGGAKRRKGQQWAEKRNHIFPVGD